MEQTPKPQDEASSEEKTKGDAIDERSQHLGCGLALVLIGGGMLAQNLGWIPEGDWIWPAALIGLGAGYLYKAFRM